MNLEQQQQQQQQQQQHARMNMGPTAPIASPFGSNVPYAAHQVTHSYANMQQDNNTNNNNNVAYLSSNNPNVFGATVSGMNPFDSINVITSTNNGYMRVSVKPMDLSMVPDAGDRGLIEAIHKNMTTLKDDVPFFDKKEVTDMGLLYKVYFSWMDEQWEYSNALVNKKIMSLPGVTCVNSGTKHMTVLVKKRGEGQEEEGEGGYQRSFSPSTIALNGPGDPAFPSLDYKDPVTTSLYRASNEEEAELMRHIVNSYPSMPPAQKGLMLRFAKDALRKADERKMRRKERSRRKDANAKVGLRKEIRKRGMMW